MGGPHKRVAARAQVYHRGPRKQYKARVRAPPIVRTGYRTQPSTLPPISDMEVDSFYNDLMSGAFEDDAEEAYIPPPSSAPPASISSSLRRAMDEL